MNDLILRGGTVIDPASGVHGVRDVHFLGGVVSSPGEAAGEIDCTGLIVTPGLVDVHTHVFPGVGYLGVDPDETCLARGVTTVLDAGTAGAATFAACRKFVIDTSGTRVFALLNISMTGMLDIDVGELMDLRHADVDKCVAVIEANRDVIIGVKVRLSADAIVSREAGFEPMRRAREAASRAGLPMMVHPMGALCDSVDDILALMEAGDVMTHCFHGLTHGILDASGIVRPAVLEARERGVLFDVGHGAGSFTWDVAERALGQGFVPDTISSDIHQMNVNGPVWDLATVVSKFLHLGLTLDDAIARVTSAPAQILRTSPPIGTLAEGASGDAAVFALREGPFELPDVTGAMRRCAVRLDPVHVVRGGVVVR